MKELENELRLAVLLFATVFCVSCAAPEKDAFEEKCGTEAVQVYSPPIGDAPGGMVTVEKGLPCPNPKKSGERAADVLNGQKDMLEECQTTNKADGVGWTEECKQAFIEKHKLEEVLHRVEFCPNPNQRIARLDMKTEAGNRVGRRVYAPLEMIRLIGVGKHGYQIGVTPPENPDRSARISGIVVTVPCDPTVGECLRKKGDIGFMPTLKTAGKNVPKVYTDDLYESEPYDYMGLKRYDYNIEKDYFIKERKQWLKKAEEEGRADQPYYKNLKATLERSIRIKENDYVLVREPQNENEADLLIVCEGRHVSNPIDCETRVVTPEMILNIYTMKEERIPGWREQVAFVERISREISEGGIYAQSCTS